MTITPLKRITPATVDVLDALLTTSDALWGLAIVKATGRPAGSIYPILERLETAGWVVSEWEADTERSGPRRRLYRLEADAAPAVRSAIAHLKARPARPSITPGTAFA
ncbi:PadR family transcriptional regulator [Homoserinimonas aerilata]|uniref:PadR family transcriptional regulator n=1 Tax=Homoserinimonas aerilata TaxID=1162970 RepID=A0A542YGH7_9MICO|nr:helix-turn-helix transcriptional regulator [Homoserinimonas aerilata]TQL47202.1 PadR family transcriptional regulator [Homoserinimonas aerilata]